nr:ergothioneine biosynthesis protein EgtB [Solimonas sp. SE-A11]
MTAIALRRSAGPRPLARPATVRPVGEAAALAVGYQRVRAATEALCAPLSPEDAGAQSMKDASPAKWHLAHTTWFFETMVLSRRPGYRVFDRRYLDLFNSYYQRLGKPFERAARGLLTRPSLQEVMQYRAQVDRAMLELLAAPVPAVSRTLIELGLHHEQQHQELILTDLKHLLSRNPLQPAYGRAPAMDTDATATPLRWLRGGGEVACGHGGSGFAFDNEQPRHAVLLAPYEIASRAVTNREYRAFIEDEGYRRPELWLSDGWAVVQRRKWRRPLYWARDLRSAFTLAGLQPLHPEGIACHLSYYEADAYARWAGLRLPTEQEWEALAEEPTPAPQDAPPRLHPGISDGAWYGGVWTWTSSAYSPYPGYRAPPGVVGEYNGKFMCNQLVLRGGSCATPPSHLRRSYRNFFPPEARWQFSGLRLARDIA